MTAEMEQRIQAAPTKPEQGLLIALNMAQELGLQGIKRSSEPLALTLPHMSECMGNHILKLICDHVKRCEYDARIEGNQLIFSA